VREIFGNLGRLSHTNNCLSQRRSIFGDRKQRCQV
jgi:hypothetical protein